MTSKMIFVVLLAVLGFLQCFHDSQAKSIDFNNKDVERQLETYGTDYVPGFYREPTFPQRCIAIIRRVLNEACALFFNIFKIPIFLIRKAITLPITITIKAVKLLLLPAKLLLKFVRLLLCPQVRPYLLITQ